MFRWTPFAMVRVTLFFVAGILVGITYSFSHLFVIETTLAVFLGNFFLLALLIKSPYIKSLLGFVGLMGVLLLGILHVHFSVKATRAGHILSLKEKIQCYEVVMTRYAEEKQRSWKLEAEIRHIKTGGKWMAATGRMVLYFSKNDFRRPYNYGDVLLIRGMPELVPLPGNPGEFNLREFQANKGIYHQHYITSGNAVHLGHEAPSHLIQMAVTVRSWADGRLNAVIQGQQQRATVSALVLGVTDGLDSDLLQAYASTGAMHVLAVSGLHVSIIYWIILLLFKPLDASPRGKWILAFGSLVILWSYAFITGWSPSVLRAVTMFSFVALARPWRQSTNIYNTLASSLFCLLLYDPFMITSLGLQLSYLAVFGIVYLQPKLYPLWEPRHRIWDEIWKITSVSIAAQITTLPISLLYFHQFPNYFLLSNLLVIPISFIVLVMGLAILAVSWLPFMAGLLGWSLTWVVYVMNKVIFITEDLPFSLIEGIYITPLQSLVLAILIWAVIQLFVGKRFRFLWYGIVAAIVFSVLQWDHFFNDVVRSKLTIYKVNKYHAVDFFKDGHTNALMDSAVNADPGSLKFHVQPNRVKYGITHAGYSDHLPMHIGDGYSLAVWNGKVIVQITAKRAKLPMVIDADWVIVANNSIHSLKEITDRIKCKILIMDSSNSSYFANRIMEEGRRMGIVVYSVPHQGAFEFLI